MSHTAIPWFVGAMNDCLFIIDQPPRPDAGVEGGGPPASVIAKLDYPDAEGNAEFIRRACNCHNELLDVLKRVRDMLYTAVETNVDVEGFDPSQHSGVKACDAAIARAEGKPDAT